MNWKQLINNKSGKAEDEDFVPTIPDFISDKEETLRANERGTAYHRVMECLDYNKIESLDDVKADIKKCLILKNEQHAGRLYQGRGCL